jgi:RimJ/RimL family protein N-acetyltransferase
VPGMAELAGYSTPERLPDGRMIEIRAVRPEDREAVVAAVGRASTKSLYRRFFGVRRQFTEKETQFFLNVDFVDHVALVTVAEEDGRRAIVGGGRYVVVQPGQAEVAFFVIDQYQGLGIGSALLRHLIAIARNAGLERFVADVLPENLAMLTVFERSGLRCTTTREAGTVQVKLQLD